MFFIFNKETGYWQEEYRKGDLDDDDMSGEMQVLLDGTAEKMFLPALIHVLIVTLIVFIGCFLFVNWQVLF